MAVADGGRAAARGDRLVKLIRSRGAVTCHRSFTYVLPNSQAAAPSLEERVRGSYYVLAFFAKNGLGLTTLGHAPDALFQGGCGGLGVG